MFFQRFVTLFMIKILPRVLNMDCKWPELAFCSEIPVFYSFERWSKYLRLGNRWKIDTLVQQFYGCFALQVFEPVTWLKTINWSPLMIKGNAVYMTSAMKPQPQFSFWPWHTAVLYFFSFQYISINLWSFYMETHEEVFVTITTGSPLTSFFLFF